MINNPERLPKNWKVAPGNNFLVIKKVNIKSLILPDVQIRDEKEWNSEALHNR